jgi:hypothetical protein
MQLIEIKQNYKKIFARQTDEQLKANIDSLDYITKLAKSTNINVFTWNIVDLFADKKNKKQSLELIKDKNEINKIFFTYSDSIQNTPNAELELIEKTVKNSINVLDLKLVNDKKQKLQRLIEIKTNEMSTYNNYIMNNISSIVSARQEMLKIVDVNIKDKIISDVIEILKGGFYEFHELNGYNLILVTKDSIINTYKNINEGIDLTLNLGKFKIIYNLEIFTLKVYPHENNYTVSSFYHPHVNDSGEVCWGNVSVRASELLANAEIKEALNLLSVLLTTYNPDNPYRTLAQFNDVINPSRFKLRTDNTFSGQKIRRIAGDERNLLINSIYTLEKWSSNMDGDIFIKEMPFIAFASCNFEIVDEKNNVINNGNDLPF